VLWFCAVPWVARLASTLLWSGLLLGCGSSTDQNRSTGVSGSAGSSAGSGASGGLGGSGAGAGGIGGAAGSASGGIGGAGGSGQAGSGGVGAAAPCGVSTGYEGDELCIKPPDPSSGFQLHYGPASYDAAAVAPFLLAPGQEKTDCFWLVSPNNAEVFLSEYHATMRPGSHHMIVSAENGTHPNGLSACETGFASRLLVGSSTAKKDFPDPGVVVPENAGLALKLGAQTTISFQMHYINTTNRPILREAWVNFVYKDPATVTTLVDPLFLVAGTLTSIAPRTNHVTRGTCAAPADLRIVEVHGHYHAHTVRLSAWRVAGTQRTLVYESYDWHEPASLQFDSGHNNPPPNPQGLVPGGYNGLLELKRGDRIEWECDVHNDSDATLRFTNQVYTGEMCILSGNYAPSFGGTWNCSNP